MDSAISFQFNSSPPPRSPHTPAAAAQCSRTSPAASLQRLLRQRGGREEVRCQALRASKTTKNTGKVGGSVNPTEPQVGVFSFIVFFGSRLQSSLHPYRTVGHQTDRHWIQFAELTMFKSNVTKPMTLKYTQEQSALSPRCKISADVLALCLQDGNALTLCLERPAS